MDRTDVLRALDPLMMLFGPPKFEGDMVDERGAATLNNSWLDLWTRSLRTMTPEALNAAVDEWVRKGKPFWPKPSDLIKLGEKITLHQQKLLYRLKVACTTESKHKPPPTPEEQAKVREMLEDFKRTSAARPMTNRMDDAHVPRRPNDGLVNELVQAGLRRDGGA